MNTNLDLTDKAKGLKRLGILILLLILSPISLTLSFKALKKFTEEPQTYIGYSMLIISFFIIIFTLFFALKTFKFLLNSLFEK